MSNPIPLERSEVKESGQAIQEAQNTTITAGTAVTIALIRELLKNLKLPKKPVNVEIKMNDSVAYKANIDQEKNNSVDSYSLDLSKEQLDYLREVIKLPVSNEPNSSDISLDKDVTITIDKTEVFSLKNGVVETNLLVPQLQQSQEKSVPQVPQTVPKVEQNSELPVTEAQVEVLQESEVPNNLKPVDISFSNSQREQLKEIGVEPQALEEVIKQNHSSSVPIIIVVNREVNERVPKASLKNNLQRLASSFKSATQDFSRKVSSVITSIRERLFPASEQNIKNDLKSLAVVEVASSLLDRYGSAVKNGTQVFEGNSFRLERSDKNITVSAKDGRGTILSLKDGQLTSSLTQKDVEKFQAVARQLQGQSRSKQSQMEIG